MRQKEGLGQCGLDHGLSPGAVMPSSPAIQMPLVLPARGEGFDLILALDLVCPVARSLRGPEGEGGSGQKSKSSPLCIHLPLACHTPPWLDPTPTSLGNLDKHHLWIDINPPGLSPWCVQGDIPQPSLLFPFLGLNFETKLSHRKASTLSMEVLQMRSLTGSCNECTSLGSLSCAAPSRVKQPTGYTLLT